MPAPTTPAAAGSPPGCSRSPATWRSTICARSAPSRSTPTRFGGAERALWATAARHQDAAERGAGELRDSLAELPEDQRRALLLAALFGFTAREIGEIEHIPLGTAKTRIRTATMKLAEAEEEAR